MLDKYSLKLTYVSSYLANSGVFFKKNILLFLSLLESIASNEFGNYVKDVKNKVLL